MYRSRQVRIKKGHGLYGYFRDLCQASALLYNRGNYILRQYATAVRDLEDGKELTPNQEEIYALVRKITAGTRFAPSGKWLNYGQLDYLLKMTRDQAYRGLPAQANQQILKILIRNYKSFFEALKVYTVKPEAFTGRPRIPGYKKKGRAATAILTNQICRIKEGKYLKFPGTKKQLNLGVLPEESRLKEVKIKPEPDCFAVHVVLELPEAGDSESETAKKLLRMEIEALKEYLAGMERADIRTVSIDPGLENFCAVTNNFGEKPFLIKGRILKSENRYYNKELARLKTQAMKCNHAYSTKRIERLHGKRNRVIRDQMHKISRWITRWAKENGAELVVLGHNVYQKQRPDMGAVNNQRFVQIPHEVFAGMLRYKLNEAGIAFLETEESYTSKADFLAGDRIPVYGREDEEGNRKAMRFSGKRINRGMYRHGNGQISNADINGAGNILRKVFPNVTEWNRGVVDTPYAVRIA